MSLRGANLNAAQKRLGASLKDRRVLGFREKKPRRKYRNEITSVGSLIFDSKGEAQRYLVLKDMEARGEICDLQIQVPFVLLPPQALEKTKERGVKYIADFVYQKGGLRIVEDVKSVATKTPEFVIKRKLMMYFHKIVVREVLV